MRTVARHLYHIGLNRGKPSHYAGLINIRVSDSWDLTHDQPIEDHGDYVLRVDFAQLDAVELDWCTHCDARV